MQFHVLPQHVLAAGILVSGPFTDVDEDWTSIIVQIEFEYGRRLPSRGMDNLKGIGGREVRAQGSLEEVPCYTTEVLVPPWHVAQQWGRFICLSPEIQCVVAG